MEQPVHKIVRYMAILVGVVVCFSCDDCGRVDGANLSSPSPRSFMYINGTNNLAQGRAEMRAGAETIAIPGNVAFGTGSAKHTVTRTNAPMTANVIGVSSTWTGQSAAKAVGDFNLIVSTSIPGANAVDWQYITPYPEPVIWVVRDRGANMDVYITAPGASLATLQPDTNLTQLGVLKQMPFGSLHVNTAFQVRLTAAGTKTVLVDFGTQPAMPAGTHRVLLHAHTGNTPSQHGITVDPR